MALFRCSSGGGGGFDIGAIPDVEFHNNSAGTSGTETIAVTQKPRMIVLAIWSRNSAYAGALVLIDVNAEKATQCGYWGSSNHDFYDFTNWRTYVTSITSSQVVYDYAGWAGNSRVHIGIYY